MHGAVLGPGYAVGSVCQCRRREGQGSQKASGYKNESFHAVLSGAIGDRPTLRFRPRRRGGGQPKIAARWRASAVLLGSSSARGGCGRSSGVESSPVGLEPTTLRLTGQTRTLLMTTLLPRPLEQ